MKMTQKNSVGSIKTTLLTLSLVLFCAGTGLSQTNVIFPRQDTIWKYNQTNDLYTETAGGIGWTLLDYDDSGPSWQEGPALLSNDSGNGNIAPLIRTPINAPGTANPLYGGVQYHARFFRKKFTYNDAVAPFTLLRLNRRFDDGAIIWLNGVEIGRVNFSSFLPPTFTMRSECYSCGTGPCTGGGDSDCEEITLLPADALLQGENVIAIAIHQTAATSSDITFGTSLEVIVPQAPTISDPNEPADRVVLQNRSTTLRVVASASPAPTYQWYFSTSATGPFTEILDATNSTHTIPSMQASDEGYYYCTISNVIDSVDSRVAHVQYTTDSTPPQLVGALAPNFTTINVQFNEAMGPDGGVRDPFVWAVTDGVTAFSISDAIGLSADGRIVTLSFLPGETLLEDTVYTVTVTGVSDLAGNVLDEATTNFRSYTTAGCTTFLFEAFDTASAPGNAISLLTGHPNYPNNPRDVANIAGFDSRHGYLDNSHEQFGARIRGLFVPTITGPHTFYLASDDAGQLFVNPSGPDAAGKQLVAEETSCCQDYQPQGNPRTSVPINLTAGQAYYVEALYKEGTGGDWLKVAARPSGDPVPTGGNSDNGSVNPNVIQAGPGPAGILSHVTIATHPTDVNAIAGQAVRFSVGLSLDVPGCFQWKKDGADIPGAIGPNYNLTASLADDNTRYSVVVSLLGGTVLTSTEAVLNVENDVTSPSVTNVSVTAAGDVLVSFNEAVGANANTAANYLVDGAVPTSATAAGNTVTLVPATPLALCPVTHSVRVADVTDAFNNVVSPNPTTVNFANFNLGVLTISAAQNWRYNDDGFELGDAWYATGFDDSAWSNGAPTFAFPAGEVIAAGFPVRTVLIGVRGTTYFRTHFNVPTDPSTVTNLQLQTILDDGGIFYLNGQELTRIRMPAGLVESNTLSTASSPSDPPQILETYNVPSGALQFGDNVIAARVHQSSATSSDTVFAAGLVAQVSSCQAERPRLKISQSGNTVLVELASGPNGTIYRSSSLDGPWTAVGPAPQTVTIGAGNTFFEIRP